MSWCNLLFTRKPDGIPPFIHSPSSLRTCSSSPARIPRGFVSSRGERERILRFGAPTNESERHRREKARTESGLSRSKHRRQCNSHGKGGREVPKSRLRQEPKKKSQTLKYETCLFIQNIFVSETGFEFFNLRPLLPLLGAPLRSSLVLLPGIPYESSGREGKQAKILVGQKRR